eukprot:Gb_18338 [translate_table: standard]
MKGKATQWLETNRKWTFCPLLERCHLGVAPMGTAPPFAQHTIEVVFIDNVPIIAEKKMDFSSWGRSAIDLSLTPNLSFILNLFNPPLVVSLAMKEDDDRNNAYMLLHSELLITKKLKEKGNNGEIQKGLVQIGKEIGRAAEGEFGFGENELADFQVLKDEQPLPNSIVIDIGAQLQAISNDKYKSAWHCVLAIEYNNIRSVASFYNNITMQWYILLHN